METAVAKKIRIFRNEETILNILTDYKKSGLSIKAFCIEKNIAQASFHNWKKKYNYRTAKRVKPAGFVGLQITPPAVVEPLFASVKEIKIYQWVTAAYLKELLKYTPNPGRSRKCFCNGSGRRQPCSTARCYRVSVKCRPQPGKFIKLLQHPQSGKCNQ